MKTAYWCLCISIIAIGLGAAYQLKTIELYWSVLRGYPPVAEYPTIINLGHRAPDEVVTSRFELCNSGGQDLILTNVRTSCSCGSLARVVGERSENFEELRLAPGEKVTLVIHTTVRVDAAGTYTQSIVFRTNEVDRPEGKITVTFQTAAGSIRARPATVQFGHIPVGRKKQEVVEIVDRDHVGQTISGVVSADPTRVVARWAPAVVGTEADAKEAILGRIELEPITTRPTLLDTTITVEFTDSKIQPLKVQVTGRVIPVVEVFPELLALPLSSGDAPIYSATCQVRCSEGVVSLEVESVSPGLKIELPGKQADQTGLVRVTWIPAPTDLPGANQKNIRLRVLYGNKSEIMNIPVTCER